MLQPIVEYFEKLIDQFSWRRLFVLFSVLGFILCCLIVFESYTGYFRLSTLEKTVNVIEKINSLPIEISGQSKELLSSATKSAAENIEEFSRGGSTPFSISSGSLKVIAASFPWLLLILALSLSKSSFNKSAALGILLFALPGGVISYFIPLFEKSWINYVAIPIGYFVVSCLIAIALNKRRVSNKA